MFTVREARVPGATNLDFRYVETALFLKPFPKFTDDHANHTEVMERVGEVLRDWFNRKDRNLRKG